MRPPKGVRTRSDDPRDDDAQPVPEMPRLTMPPPGTAAGIEADELSGRASGPGRVAVTCVDYSPEQVEIAGGRPTSPTSSPAIGRRGRTCAGSTSTA